MLDAKTLSAVDEAAKRYQPPPRATERDTARDVLNDGVVLVCGGNLTPQPIAWLWQYWLALGKLHVLAGPAGEGKTTLALAMGATVTMAGRWPDGGRCDAGNVLIWSGEDDPADTLLPRLIAMGADKDRVYFVQGSRIDGEVVPFDPARDLGQLLAAIENIGGIRLLVVDPIVSAVAGDSHKNTEVRRSLQPLVDLASSCQCAVLGISHFSKGGQGQDPTSRVVGSIAFGAVARVVMVAARVRGEDGEVRRILARSKSNIGPDSGGFEYDIDQVEALPGIQASRIGWGKAVDGTARELLTDPDEQLNDSTIDTIDLLRAELSAECWTSSDTAGQPLKDAGFSKKQIWSASRKLRVMRKKDGMKGGWLWRLPGVRTLPFKVGQDEDSTEDSEGSSIQSGESSESSGDVEPSVALDDGRASDQIEAEI